MSRKLVGNLLLLLTAFIWGTAFVAQSIGMDYIEPFTFNALRTLIGGMVLLPVLAILRRGREAPSSAVRRSTWVGGLWCGVVLFAASSLQQFGIVYTTAGKAGFITALYIVLVPLCGLFMKKRVRPIVWCAVALAAVGLYWLCIHEDFSISTGDLLVLCCAILFTAHILIIDAFSPRGDSVMISCIQFFVAGTLGLIAMFVFEAPTPRTILACMGPILYAGVLSSGVAYTLQIVAQKNTDPAVASLLLSLEAVFGALAGWLILGETFTAREFSGALLMIGAIVLAQWPKRRRA